MRRLSLIIGCTTVAALLLALAIPGLALAHERRTIGGGKYDVVVGWDREPAFVSQQNAPSIRIYRAGTQDLVEGIEKTLKVRVAFGGNEPKEFPLRSVFGQKGYYVVDLFPTKVGADIFTFVGDIEGTPINERFESGPGRFNDVQSTEALQFPQTLLDPLTTSDQLKAAKDDAAMARTLAIAGIVVGMAGVVVGGASLAMRRRS